jgi:hypothetical protein
VAACQKTGFRMILKCTTALLGSKDSVDETYHDRPCLEAQSALQSLERGKFAEYGSGATSVTRFCGLMVLLSIVAYFTLSYRRQSILNEVYSKLTIVKNRTNH